MTVSFSLKLHYFCAIFYETKFYGSFIMGEPFSFDLQCTDSQSSARAGVFSTAHGDIETPIFMPVGTQASVKSLSPEDLYNSDASIILANTYHLHLRPGSELIKAAGGLHKFENWNRAILTDSGGFQVFSLRDISKITEDGVWFRSHIDGSKHFFSPESVMEIEHNLGADIIMAFDECPPAKAPIEDLVKAVERTLRWARRCKESHESLPFHHGYPQALFGIVQGSTNEALRKRCTLELMGMDFPGYALGGFAVGEPAEEMYPMVKFTTDLLPQVKPRYLMGVGKPQNILESIERGIDMFDCVMPSRNGRNGSVYTYNGKVNIRNQAHRYDFDNALDNDCECYACKNFSRAYLRHLYQAGEILALRMLTLHNVHFFVQLTRDARTHILNGTFKQWKKEVMMKMGVEEFRGI